jgi:hypothetical protein
MRSIIPAILLVLAIAPMTPEVAICQQYEHSKIEPDEDLPARQEPERRPIRRPRRTWRNSPILWAGAGIGLAVALPFGVFRVVRQMRYAATQAERPKAPWEGEPNK